MQIPLQITYRDLHATPAIEARLRQEARKLEHFHDRMVSCRVVLSAPHRRHHKGRLYHVRIDITLPGAEVVVNREPRARRAHEDVMIAIRDAFDAAARRLQEHARKRRGEVKQHQAPPHGRVVRLFERQGYGFIASADGREIYFHKNAVANDAFASLELGAEVRFAEARGDKGPQATTVTPMGKHHIVE